MTPEFPTPQEALGLIESREGFELDDEWGCWLWWATPNSYGPVLAFFEAAFGEVPAGMKLYHRCPNGRRGCVRPRHLDVIPDDMEVPSFNERLSMAEKERFRTRIHDERRARRYTVTKMAKHLGVSHTTLAAWESGEATPTPDRARDLAHKLGWDDEEREWAVALVVQRIVRARSAGAAARAVAEGLEHEGEHLKFEISEVRPLRELKRSR